MQPTSDFHQVNQRCSLRFRLGEYVLGETIGQGAYGKVKLATHRQTGHKVAVKIIRLDLLPNAKATLKVRREIGNLKSLEHPHIIRLYDVVSTPTDIFMVMEYVSGGELFEFLSRNGRVRQSLARKLFQQIICAVEYMHHFRIVHRDLKPENLLIDDQTNVKIADFGLSNVTSDSLFLSTSCGSPNYAAPEVILGRLYMGPEVDVWSCGVILYVMLVGRLPFDEDSIPALFSKIKEGNYPEPHFLTPGAKELIAKMLVVDPLTRITIAEVRRTPWFLEDLPDYLVDPPRTSHSAIDPHLLHIVAQQMDVPYNVAYETITKGTRNNLYNAYELLLKASQQKRGRALSMGATHASNAPVLPVASSAPSSTGLYRRQSSPQRVTDSPANLKLRPSPIMVTYMLPGPVPARETYNERSSFSHSPSLLGSILSLTPTNRSFGGSLKEHTGSLRVSEPIGIPQPNQVEVGCSPMSFSSGKGSGAAGSSPAISHLAAAMEMHRANILNESEPPVHQNWRLGLFTELHSNSVMQEVYKVLQSLSFTWKVHSSFHLIARQKCVKDDDAVVAIGVQLYRMQERHDRGYLVDLYVHSDLILPAVDQIHRLYMILTDVIGA
eukprot:GGOE01006772.1.p1 GENE.GGOE01006772.1~~GGOE01006772.1.p1  ORF type:complete len:609 (+),score=149.25 GGOE01006772.1:95-1921(+)